MLAIADAPAEQKNDRQEYAPGRTVFFKNAGEAASSVQLARHFERAGVISKFTLLNRGSGIVEYTSVEAAQIAFESIHDSKVAGRYLQVEGYAP